MAQCDCTYHRYHVVHICSCRRIVAHSQDDRDVHRFHDMGFTVSAEYFQHSDSVDDLIERAVKHGIAQR